MIMIPMGDRRNDYFTGDPDFSNPANNSFNLGGGAPSTLLGKGPNTRIIMRIMVDNTSGVAGKTMPNMNVLNTALYQNFFGGNPVPPQQEIPRYGIFTILPEIPIPGVFTW